MGTCRENISAFSGSRSWHQPTLKKHVLKTQPGNTGWRLDDDDHHHHHHQHPSHLDVVGVFDQLVDVRRLSAQLRRLVLQDDALAGAAVQAVGRLSSRCT